MICPSCCPLPFFSFSLTPPLSQHSHSTHLTTSTSLLPLSLHPPSQEAKKKAREDRFGKISTPTAGASAAAPGPVDEKYVTRFLLFNGFLLASSVFYTFLDEFSRFFRALAG
jgi:hypothetical protein